MRKFLVLALLIAFLFPVVAKAQRADNIVKWRLGLDEAGAEKRIGERWPLPTQKAPFTLFNASQSISVGTSAAVCISTLNANTRKVLIGATDAQVNFGNINVPAATFPFHVDADTYIELDVATRTPAFYFRGAFASATVNILEE